MRQNSDKSLDDHFKDGQYPILFNRDERFPNGESLNDVATRAERSINDLVLKPYLSRAISSGVEDVHVAVVSHGLCISELIQALLKRNDGGAPTEDYRGLMNTAWTRVTVQVKVMLGPLRLARLTKCMQPGAEVLQITDELENPPPLIVTVTDVNRHEHITNVVSHHLHNVAHCSSRSFSRNVRRGSSSMTPNSGAFTNSSVEVARRNPLRH